MQRTLLVSDIHLCPARLAVVRMFLDFLAKQAPQADALYILGDLFEYWAGDDDLADPFNAAIVTALKDLVDKGTQVFLLVGNRDFLIGKDFARASGATLLDEPHLSDLDGTPTLLLHGDTLCTDDPDYRAFRDKVRDKAWQQAFLALPLSERKAQIEQLRCRSEQEKQTKSSALMDVNPEAVENLLRAYGYPRLIHGHTHRQARHEILIDGHRCERWVLGNWYDSGNTLSCSQAGCHAQMFPFPFAV